MKIRNVRFYWLLLVAVLSMSWCQFSLAQDADIDVKDAKPLSKKVLGMVDKIIPAIRHRNENEFLQLGMPLIKSSSPEQLELIDQTCLDHGVAKLTDWFAELVVGNALQGIDPTRAIKNRQMARVVLFGVADDLEEFEQSLGEHVVMQSPLAVSTDFQESEKLFWDIHVLHNEFDNNSRKLQLANALLKRHGKALKRQGDGEALVQRFGEIESRLEDQYKDIDERAAELRLQRFKAAHQVLTAEENKDNFELMLTSAMALEQDGQVLAAFFKDNDSIARESLSDSNLPGEISQLLKTGREAGGEVTKKANLFRNGLHYWVRGRYGAGPLTGGLVKAPNATSSVEAMELLSMPKLRDKPISSYHTEEETSPGYDRRHHYTWSAERRSARVVGGRELSSNTTTKTFTREGPERSETRFL